MKHYAPKGMHYVVLEIEPGGTEHFIYACKEMREAESVINEVWNSLSLMRPSDRVALRCVDD